MKKITVEAIQHSDVRGNVLYYLKITSYTKKPILKDGVQIKDKDGKPAATDVKDELLINVGVKTYESVAKMTAIDQPELNLDNK